MAGLLLAMVVLTTTACGDNGVKATKTENTRADATTAPPSTVAPQDTIAPPGSTSPQTAVSATDQATAASSVPLVEGSLSDHECPSDDSISTAVGRPMAFDSSDVQAKGFCPYKSSDEDITVSVTFTPMDITAFADSSQTEVPGLGQKALWSEGSDELDVWLGNGSIIVSVLAFGQGPDFDSLTIATNIAKSVVST